MSCGGTKRASGNRARTSGRLQPGDSERWQACVASGHWSGRASILWDGGTCVFVALMHTGLSCEHTSAAGRCGPNASTRHRPQGCRTSHTRTQTPTWMTWLAAPKKPARRSAWRPSTFTLRRRHRRGRRQSRNQWEGNSWRPRPPSRVVQMETQGGGVRLTQRHRIVEFCNNQTGGFAGESGAQVKESPMNPHTRGVQSIQ